MLYNKTGSSVKCVDMPFWAHIHAFNGRTSLYSLSIGRLPLISISTMDIGILIGNHQLEIAFFQYPLAIMTYEGKIIGIQIEGNGLGLTWLKLYLVEGTEATTIRHHTGDEIAAEQENALFARNLARILHIHAHLDDVAVAEIRLGNLQIAIFVRGVAQTISQTPLHLKYGLNY